MGRIGSPPPGMRSGTDRTQYRAKGGKAGPRRWDDRLEIWKCRGGSGGKVSQGEDEDEDGRTRGRRFGTRETEK